MNGYGYTRKVNLFFDEAVDEVTEKLGDEGFGVLCEINVKETLKKKLDKDFDNYIILGACNPSFAYEALKVEKEIGLLLPCNIIIYSDEEDNVFVSAIVPSVAMGMVDNPRLGEVALEVESKLKGVIDSI